MNVGLPPKKRKLFHKIMAFLHDPDDCSVGLLFGIRQVGKTVLLKQLAQEVSKGVYVNCKDKKFSAKDWCRLLNQEAVFYFIDEITAMEGYDTELECLFLTLQNLGKKCKLIFSSSSYGALKQLNADEFGGGRAHPFELFPLSFEEYVYFSGDYSSYADIQGQNLGLEDIVRYLSLDGIPEGMKIVFNRKYFETWYEDVKLGSDNKYRCERILHLEGLQITAIIDILAYTLNETNSLRRLKKNDVSHREFGKWHRFSFEEALISIAKRKFRGLSTKDIGISLAWGLDNGFLFLDLERTQDKVQDYSTAYYEIGTISSIEDLGTVLKKYVISPISPLMYSRLRSDLETIAGREMINQLFGGLFELAIKAEDIYLQGWKTWHVSYRYNHLGREVDLVGYGIKHGQPDLLLEATLSRKDISMTCIHAVPGEHWVRVMTFAGAGREYERNFYRIGAAEALFILSTGEIYDLPLEILGNKTICEGCEYGESRFSAMPAIK